jgi:hypothetical protein
MSSIVPLSPPFSIKSYEENANEIIDLAIKYSEKVKGIDVSGISTKGNKVL